MNVIVDDIEKVGRAVRAGFVFIFHAAEHEVVTILSTAVNLYGPEVVAHAIATHSSGVKLYADKEIAVAEADTKALVQSALVDRFHLAPTAAQWIASAVHHVFTIGEDKVNALIDAGTKKLEAATVGSSPIGGSSPA